MAWKASGVVDQRRKFVQEYESGEWTMAELCRVYEISRESGYKWIKRIRAEGEQGLERSESSTAVSSQSDRCQYRAAGAAIASAARDLGPRKLLYVLGQKQPRLVLPAASTIGALLKREGLTVARRARRKTPPYTQPFKTRSNPTSYGCADF